MMRMASFWVCFQALTGWVVLGPSILPVEFLLHTAHFFFFLIAQEADPYRLHLLWLPFGFAQERLLQKM